MKSLLIVSLLVMVFAVGTAHAQPFLYEVAPCGTKDFTTAADVVPGGTICLDIYLTGVGVGNRQNAGGFDIDSSGSVSDITIVSAGRAFQDGSEGIVGPWTNGAGANIPYPAGPGTHMLVVANLGGAAPDGDGDLIIGTFTLQNTGPNDATVNITLTPSTGTWTPLDDNNVVSGAIVISQVCDCIEDSACNEGLFCNGEEYCFECACYQGTNPCPTDTTCNEVTDTCDPIPATGIPTLSEWGIIIFMTIILGMGVVTLVRRRMG